MTGNQPTPAPADAPRSTALWAPIPTPFDSSGDLDEASIDRVVDYLGAAGVGGLWVNGTTGEFHSLDDAERAASVARAVRASGGRMRVAAHIGDTSLARVIEHGRRALDAGADVLACMPPFYFAHGQEELVGYFTAVAEALDRPLYLYDFPAYCKVAIDPATVATLARSGLAVGIKESGLSLDHFRRIMTAARAAAPDFHCLHGVSALFATYLYLGADGAVSAGINVAPEAYVRVLDAARRGDWAAAQTAQTRINRLWDALNAAVSDRPALTAPNIPAIKAWLTAHSIFETTQVRTPTQQITRNERARLDAVVEEFGS